MSKVTATPEDCQKPVERIAIVGFEGYLSDYTITSFRMPRIGPVIIGSILREKGYRVRVFAEGVGGIDKKVIDYLQTCDLVAFSVLTYGANRAYALADLLRSVNPKIRILMGDVHPTIMPEHCLAHCDFVIRGEGDESMLDVLACLNREPGARPFSQIEGLSYWEGDQIRHNPNRARPTNVDVMTDLSLVEDFVTNEWYTMFKEGRRTLAVMQASRGCPVACKFCLGAAILGTGYRIGTIERVIESLHDIRRRLGDNRTVFFIDNHLFIKPDWTKKLLRQIIKEKLNKFAYIAFGQYYIGRDIEMLDLLREAGFIRIFVGFESINPNTLKEYNKKQSEASMRECIAGMHAHGVHVHGSFMLGGETDTPEVAEATIRFALDTNITTASFFGLTEYPFENHSFVPTTNMLPRQRLLPDNLDFYNLNFVSIYPKMMPPSRLQRYIIDAHDRFFSVSRAFKALASGDKMRFYQRITGYWGQRVMVKQMRDYLPYLEEAEAGKYDQNGHLIESKLSADGPILKNPTPFLFHKMAGVPELPPPPRHAHTPEEVTRLAG